MTRLAAALFLAASCASTAAIADEGMDFDAALWRLAANTAGVGTEGHPLVQPAPFAAPAGASLTESLGVTLPSSAPPAAAPGLREGNAPSEGARPQIAGPPTTEASAAEIQGEFRLRLLDAQLLAQTGQLSESRRRLQAITRAAPDSPEPVAALAGIAQQTGRWRGALDLYREALRLDPNELSVVAAVAAIERTQARRLRTDFEYRDTQGGVGTDRTTAIIAGVSGHEFFGDGWRAGFSFDAAQVDAGVTQRADGTVGSFKGLRRRAELYVQHDGLDGDIAVGSLFLTGDTPGAGLRAELPDDSGVTLLRGEYRRPNWDFFQSLINNGTRDRVSAGRRQQFGGDITGRLETGANRYGIERSRDLVRTVTVAGELRLGNLARVRGLSTAYIFDGEYLRGRTERIGAGGQSFAPLEVLDRELHALILSYAGVFGAGPAEGALTYEATGGYGVDRYGKSGPLLTGALGYSRGNFDLRLRGSYVQNIGRTRGTTKAYGTALTWLF